MSADPPALPSCIDRLGDGCLLRVAVVPHARRTAVDGVHDGALRLRLAAQPVDGQANSRLLAWLAGELGCGKRCVRLRRGGTSRRKEVQVDLPATVVADWLASVPAAPAPLQRERGCLLQAAGDLRDRRRRLVRRAPALARRRAAQRRRGARAVGRGLLPLRPGAAVPHDGAAGFRRAAVAHARRVLRARRWCSRSPSTCGSDGVPRRRGRRRSRGAGDGRRSPSSTATRCRSASRWPRRCSAKPGSRCTSRWSACTG